MPPVADVAALGYQALGEHGLPRRRFYRRDEERRADASCPPLGGGRSGGRTASCLSRFPDAHPERAARYGKLKTWLAAQFEWDAESYIAGKDAFVRDVEVRALRWAVGIEKESAHVG